MASRFVYRERARSSSFCFTHPSHVLTTRKMSACFLIEFAYENEVYDAKICNVRGDGSCFWHALNRPLGLSTQTLKTKTAQAMERARRQKGALWLDFQAYIKHALDVPSALSGYALLDTLHRGSDPIELVRRPHQYAGGVDVSVCMCCDWARPGCRMSPEQSQRVPCVRAVSAKVPTQRARVLCTKKTAWHTTVPWRPSPRGRPGARS